MGILPELFDVSVPLPDGSHLDGHTAAIREAFNPDQARDDHGRWTDEGGTPISITDNVYDAHDGQLDATLTATRDGQKVGHLNYSIYDGKPQIQYVHSDVRRQGVGAALVGQLATQFGYENIDWGSMTPDGVALRDTLDKRYGVERVTLIFDVDDAVKAGGGTVLDRGNGQSRGSSGLYVEFPSHAAANTFASEVTARGGTHVDTQHADDGRAWVQVEIPEPRPVVRKIVREAGDNCGTGAGGFQPGNTCAKGDGEGIGDLTFAQGALTAAEQFAASPEGRTQERAWIVSPDGTAHEVHGGEMSVSLKDAPTAPAGGMLIHTHPDNYAFSHKDVISINRSARAGGASTEVVVAQGLDGPVRYAIRVTRPWSQAEWNGEILPKLERRERTIARTLNKQTGDTLTGGGPALHPLWEWATARGGPLHGRMIYERVGGGG